MTECSDPERQSHGARSFSEITPRPYLSVGIIGGMGPGSTVLFLDRLYQKFHASLGARENFEFPEIILRTVPRSYHMNALRSKTSENDILAAANFLDTCEVDFFVAPCNSAHSILDMETSGKYLSILDALELEMKNRKLGRILILCTRATANSGAYVRYFEAKSNEIIFLCEADQQELDEIILSVNHGRTSAHLDHALSLIVERHSVDHVILACTELSLMTINTGQRIVDSLDALVEATYRAATRRLDLSKLSAWRRSAK